MRFYIQLLAVLLLQSLGFSATLNVPGDYLTIQEAIDEAVNGDTVLVASGTYVENIDFLGKAITVKSEDGPASTVIDGNQSGSVVTFKNGEELDSVIRGFTITNGTGTSLSVWRAGGGIICHNNSSPTIRDCIIVKNTSNDGGGICSSTWSNNSPIIMDCVISENIATKTFIGEGGSGGVSARSSTTIMNCVISKNQAEYGGGITCRGSATINDCVITENTANEFGGGVSGVGNDITNNIISDNSAGWGAGMCFGGGSGGVIENNTISGNMSGSTGGGIYIEYSSHTFKNNTISDNSAANSAGGIYCFDASTTIADNIISKNTAYFSGGIFCCLGSPTISNNTIEQNSSTTYGGGMYFYDTNAIVTHNTIKENTASTGGGGIWCTANDSATIIGNTIFENIVNQAGGFGGGGIGIGESFPMLFSNIVSNNNSASVGGGITLAYSNNASITNNSIIQNTAQNGGGVYCFSSSPTIANTILWNNDAPNGAELCPVSGSAPVLICCDVQGGWPGSGNIDADPLFVDPNNNDFHLTYNSPCRDTGDNSAVTELFDFEGDPRVAWSGTVDMGADEFYTHLYITGDQTPGGDIQGKFVGLPGTSPVRLFIGLGGVRPTPLPTMYGDLWLLPPRLSIPLVPIPANGILTIPATIPLSPPAPYDIPMQGLVGLNSDSLTNLHVLEVR